MVPGYRAMYAGHIGKSLVNQTEGKKKTRQFKNIFFMQRKQWILYLRMGDLVDTF